MNVNDIEEGNANTNQPVKSKENKYMKMTSDPPIGV